MAHEIKVPALGESIVEATVARWLKREGEAVAAGEPVVELETDKVNLEVAADHNGVVASIAKGEGETVGIGDVLGTIEAGAAAGASPAPAAPRAEPEPQPEPQPEPAATEATAAGYGYPQAAAENQGAPQADAPSVAANENGAGAPSATPTAQKVAAEHGVDLRGLSCCGPGGRTTRE